MQYLSLFVYKIITRPSRQDQSLPGSLTINSSFRISLSEILLEQKIDKNGVLVAFNSVLYKKLLEYLLFTRY